MWKMVCINLSFAKWLSAPSACLPVRKPTLLIYLCVIKLHNELINEDNAVDVFGRSSSESWELKGCFCGSQSGLGESWSRLSSAPGHELWVSNARLFLRQEGWVVSALQQLLFFFGVPGSLSVSDFNYCSAPSKCRNGKLVLEFCQGYFGICSLCSGCGSQWECCWLSFLRKAVCLSAGGIILLIPLTLSGTDR